MKTICPFCDSDKVEKVTVKEFFPVPFSKVAEIVHDTFRCSNCEEEGDFDNSQDQALTKAVDKANLASAPVLMDSLAQLGITMTYLEKALRLPFRTTARWKRGKISHSSLALLRLIRFSPDLLEVADDNYSEQAQNRYHVNQPYIFFDRYTTNPSFNLSENDGVMDLNCQGVLHPSLITQTDSPMILSWEVAR